MSYESRPQRPRSHQIETASQKAFESLLPDYWVIRPKQNDYGIDLEVEIFEQNGTATGELFFVQLKGTDNVNEAHRVSISLSTLGYMEDLRQPVLIVRYVDTTGVLYARWAHTLNISASQEQQETVSIKFDIEHPLGSEDITELVAVVRAFRSVFLGGNPFPIKVDLHLPDIYFDDSRASDIQNEINSLLGSARRLITFSIAATFERRASRSAVFVKQQAVEICIAGRTVQELPFDSPLNGADVLCMISVAFVRGGFGARFASLLDSVVEDSQLSNLPQIQDQRVVALLESNRPIDAADRIERFAMYTYANNKNDMATLTGLVDLLGSERHNRHFIADHYVPLLARLSKNLVDLGHPKRASSLYYNTGNVLKVDDSMRRSAIRHYRYAARLDPEYLNKDYWWAELGGILFTAHRYTASAGCYTRAVSLGSRGNTLALQADSLLFSGNYRGSLEAFEAYEQERSTVADDDTSSESHPGAGGWCLKRWCIQMIIEKFGIEQGPSKTEMDSYRAAPYDANEMLKYLSENGILHPRVWFNYANIMNQTNDNFSALIGYLMAGILEPRDWEAQSNAIAIAINTSNDQVFSHLLDEVMFLHGNDFIDYFIDRQFEGRGDTVKLKRDFRRDLLAYHSERQSNDAPLLLRISDLK